MIGDRDLAWLIDQSGVYRLTCGWTMAIRVEWCDVTPGRPFGISYCLVLNDENAERILGLDNSHAFDDAGPKDPFDHEHKPGKIGQRFRYNFESAPTLWNDFFDRIEQHCARNSVAFDIEVDDD